MKRAYYIAACATVLALAGCGKTSEPGKREPGKWKMEASLEDLQITGVPDAMKAQMEGMKGQMEQQMKAQAAKEECLTPEAAAKEDVSKGFSDSMGSSTCEWSKKNVSGGKIDVAGTCTSGAQKMNLTMNGTVESKKVDVAMTMKSDAQAGQPGMSMKLKMVATHMGPCDK